MTATLTISNHGPLIAETNYWQSELPGAGLVFCSCNAGAIRVLLPPSLRSVINELRSAEYAVLSRGPWPAMSLNDAVEIMFEDHTDSPLALHLAPQSFDLLPAEPEHGKEWVVSVWDQKKGKPHKALERKCYWRKVNCIPWLKPWDGGESAS